MTEHDATTSTEGAAILAAIRELREENQEQLDKLNHKVDGLAEDDAAIRLEFRRLEQRQAGTDEDVRLLREALRKEQEKRSSEQATVAQTYEAMQRFVESSTRSNTDAVQQVVKSTEAALTRFAEASARSDEQNAGQDHRLDALEQQGKQLVATTEATAEKADQANEALGVVVEQLGVEDKVSLGRDVKPGEPKPRPVLGQLKRQGTLVAVIVALGTIAGLLRDLLHH